MFVFLINKKGNKIFNHVIFLFLVPETQDSVLFIYLHYIMSKGVIQRSGFLTSNQISCKTVKLCSVFSAAIAVIAALHFVLGANCAAFS